MHQWNYETTRVTVSSFHSFLTFRIISFKMFGWDMGHIGEDILIPVFRNFRKLVLKENGMFFT